MPAPGIFQVSQVKHPLIPITEQDRWTRVIDPAALNQPRPPEQAPELSAGAPATPAAAPTAGSRSGD